MTKFTVPGPQLRQALQTASAFMSADDTLPTLAGVHLAPVGDLVSFTATNRFIASYETLKTEGDPFTTTIPARVVTSLIAVLAPIDVDDPWDDDGQLIKPFEPFDLATLTLANEGNVTVRLVGHETVEITFVPPSMKFPDIPRIFEQAEAHTGEPLDGLCFTPAMLAAVADAVRQREDGLLQVVTAAKGKPMVVRQGDNFKALIMSVKVP